MPLGYANILQLSNKAALEIGSDATFSMQDISVYEHYFAQTPQIIKVDTGSQVVNNGDVDIWNISFAGIWGENSTGINNGNITLFNMTILLRRHRSQNLTTWPFKLQWR